MNTDRKTIVASNQLGTLSTQAALWNSLKMLGAAMLCGLAVSIAAAGVAIILSNDAEARLVQKESSAFSPKHTEYVEEQASEPSPGPGVLLTGDGCEGMPVQALERDWQVRIDGRRVEVRVMQAFQIPAESAGAAIFHVQLPQRASLRTLAAQTAGKDLSARLIRDDQYERLTAADYLKLTRDRLLVTISSQATVMTSPIMNLQADDIVTIQYTYEMTLDKNTYPSDGQQSLSLSLDTTELMPAARSVENRSPTKGALWVEWVGKNPSQVWGLPGDADLEFNQSRIEGFSWATREIEPGAQLQLSWAM